MLGAALGAPPPATAGLPDVTREPLGHEQGELAALDDDGRATLVVADGRVRSVVRRDAGGARSVLVSTDASWYVEPDPTASGDPLRLPDADAPPQPFYADDEVDVAGNARGDLVAAWFEPDPGAERPCRADGCPGQVRVAVAAPGGPLVPVGGLATSRPPYRIVARVDEAGRAGAVLHDLAGATGEQALRRAEVVGPELREAPASEIDRGPIVTGPDGTQYGVGEQTEVLFRRAAGATEFRSIALAGLTFPGVPQVAPLPDGRTVVVQYDGAGATSAIVDDRGGLGPPRALDAVFGRFTRAVRGIDGTVVAAFERSVQPGAPERFRILTVRPDGEATVSPWPGASPEAGSVALDRAGSLLLGETVADPAAPGGVTSRLRRLPLVGGEDASADLPGTRIDDLRTSGSGALAAVAEAEGGAPALLVRPPDVEPPVLQVTSPKPLRGARRQVDVRVRCDEGCVVAGARPVPPRTPSAVPGASSRAAGASALAVRGRSTRVRFRLTKAQRRTVRRRHRRGRTARLVLRVRASDVLGNASVRRVAVRIRPRRSR